jgi:hypothetical protein
MLNCQNRRPKQCAPSSCPDGRARSRPFFPRRMPHAIRHGRARSLRPWRRRPCPAGRGAMPAKFEPSSPHKGEIRRSIGDSPWERLVRQTTPRSAPVQVPRWPSPAPGAPGVPIARQSTSSPVRSLLRRARSVALRPARHPRPARLPPPAHCVGDASALHMSPRASLPYGGRAPLCSAGPQRHPEGDPQYRQESHHDVFPI